MSIPTNIYVGLQKLTLALSDSHSHRDPCAARANRLSRYTAWRQQPVHERQCHRSCTRREPRHNHFWAILLRQRRQREYHQPRESGPVWSSAASYIDLVRSPSIPANSDNPLHHLSPSSLLTVIPSGCENVCDAIQMCALLCTFDYPDGFNSFDLHYVTASDQDIGVNTYRGQWVCLMYFGNNTDASYFNVQDANIDKV